MAPACSEGATPLSPDPHFKNFIYIKNHFVLKALQESAQESDKEQVPGTPEQGVQKRAK